MAKVLVVEDWATVEILSATDDDGDVTYTWICSCGDTSEEDYVYHSTEDIIADAEVHLEHRCSLRP